ncbi:MAG: glycosyltransferase family 4 protein [Chloroflexota bacterium]|nr:glycosyltransferase family 4 protein [Chloroflexota bacterium]
MIGPTWDTNGRLRNVGLRLVFIAPFATQPKATTGARVLPLARALAARGHAVTVLVPPYDRPEEGGQTYEVGGARVEALRVDASLPEQSPWQAVMQPWMAVRLVRRALALQPDIVHVFKPKAVSGLSQLLLWYGRSAIPLLAAGRRAPAVVLDTDDWEGFGGWNEYETYPWWQKAACDWQERWGLRHAAVTVASRTLEAQAWSHRVPPARVAYLPNGLAAEDFPGWREARDALVPGQTTAETQSPERNSQQMARDSALARALPNYRPRRAPVLLLYTRFFEFLPERVVDVLERVRGAVPEAQLLVVGAGKHGQERRLADTARSRGLADAIVLAGWQAPEALPRLLATADVALFPADDNLANRAKCSVKLLQALWLGLPVVADAVGQLAEYVQDGTSGLLSAPDRPHTMADQAIRLLQDPALARPLGVAGRQRAEQDFNWPRLAAGAERAYAAALPGAKLGVLRSK